VMERLAEVAAQIRSVRQLSAIVVAMRGMAAARAQQGRALLAGIETYSGVIAAAIGQALTLVRTDERAAEDPRRSARAMILFGAEQGFAGAYNERIFSAPDIKSAATANLVIGTRGLAFAAERGIPVAWSTPMVTQPAAIPGLANRIAEVIYARIAAATSAIDVVYARTKTGGSVEVVRAPLLPFDFSRFAPAATSQPPLTTLAPAFLLERLASEYVYAELCAAATFAFTAENEARMMVMAAAKGNIDAKLEGLARREHETRQQEITAEVIELAAGAEAIKVS